MYCIVETMENSRNEQAGQACGLLPQRSVFRIKYGILELSKLLSSCRQFSTISNCHMMAMGGVDWMKESWLTDNEECCVETVLWLPGISLTRNEQQRNGSCLPFQTCTALILIRLSCAAYWVAYLCSSQFHIQLKFGQNAHLTDFEKAGVGFQAETPCCCHTVERQKGVLRQK